MTPGEEALAIQKIRACKAKYWHYMDMKRWEDLRGIFAQDAIADFRGERDLKPGERIDKLPPVDEAIAAGDPAAFKGRDLIIDNLYAGLLHEWMTFHMGGEPIIEITGPDSATGMWPLFDYISNRGKTLKGYGHYFDRYRLEDGIWKIAYIALTRIKTDGEHPADFTF